MNSLKKPFGSMTMTVGFFVILLLSFLCPLPLDADLMQPKAQIVWSQAIDGNNQIFYSALKSDGFWLPKTQLSKSDRINVAPAISSGSDGLTWVVWASVEGVTSQLAYCYFDGTGWSNPEEIVTDLSSNTGPSIIVDADNIPWIAWAGFDGVDDDIYYSKWDGGGWSKASMVNVDNNVPDVLPLILVNENNVPSICWNGFNGDTYSRYITTWTGDGWSQMKVLDGHSYDALLKNSIGEKFDLPGFIQDYLNAAIHVRMKGKLQSVPVGLIKIDQK